VRFSQAPKVSGRCSSLAIGATPRTRLEKPDLAGGWLFRTPGVSDQKSLRWGFSAGRCGLHPMAGVPRPGPNFSSDPVKVRLQPGEVIVTMRIASLYARLSSGLTPARSRSAARARRAQLGRESALVGALAVLTLASPALAQTAAGLPTEGAFVRGEGQIGQPSPNALVVTQSTQRGVIDGEPSRSQRESRSPSPTEAAPR
jgi:hypothetical protein